MLIIGLILFVFLVVVHEFGHFIVAKLNRVEAEEFGIGFPPKIFGKVMGKGIFKGYYTINLLPLGGFVKLKGEHDRDQSKGAFGAATLKAKMQIIYAGVILNFVVALLLFTFTTWVGMPQMVENQFKVKSDYKITTNKMIVNYVGVGSPAEKVGIKPGSVLLSVNGQQVGSMQQLRDLTHKNAGKKVDITFIDSGKKQIVNTTLLTESEVRASLKTSYPKAYLGVSTTPYKLAKATWSAPLVAVGTTAQLTGLTIKGIGGALGNLAKSVVSVVTGKGRQAKQEVSSAGENVAGPVGIYFILRQGTNLGIEFILFVIAVISLTLALINALPIPALDGGRAFVILFFRSLKRPLDPKTEDLIHGSGFAFLMLLFITITIVDIKRFF